MPAAAPANTGAATARLQYDGPKIRGICRDQGDRATMPFKFRTQLHRITDEGSSFRPGPVQLLIALVVCLTVVGAGTLIINLQARQLEARQKVDLLVLGSAVRARLSRELNRVLYLTSGLSSYLAVRRDDLQRDEIEAILARLYHESSHVRNFAIAVGYRLTYVYPVKGNEKAIGLHYPDVPVQWPAIKRSIDSKQPVLIGPVKLVQGGSGLIYRVPIFINGNYWGLLSSVIDSESLLVEALSEGSSGAYTLAIRGRDALGMAGDTFRGDAALFDHPEAQLLDLEVPGGKWVMALRATMPPELQGLWLMRGLVWLLALTLGTTTLIVLMQRSRLARQAMFDPLTRLPNRLLTGDRINRALSGMRRDPSRNGLLLFLDLDGFKLINDRFGHKMGDLALQSAAGRVADSLREIDTVGRWGGDEFVVFMENVDRNSINDLIEKIRLAVGQPVDSTAGPLTVGASIGFAFAPIDGMTLDELVRAADGRMYADKAVRRDMPSVQDAQ
jgi:diguanylate cyclase (GGDEF)-like protein